MSLFDFIPTCKLHSSEIPVRSTSHVSREGAVLDLIALPKRPTLNSIRQTDVDTLMIRTQSRVRVRVIYFNQTGICHQILGGVGLE